MNGLEISNLTVDLGRFKLDNINLSIRRGCITGLVGRNGAGKSTLIKTIMRQQDAAAGKILYCGKSFAENEVEVFDKIACVFDTPYFNTYIKPKNLVKLYKASYKNFDAELYEKLMQKFSLPRDLRVNKYSFGMQRKFCLILALCCRPEILILDEPTSGVDPIGRSEIIGLIQDYMLDENNTVLFSTHITEDLDKIADFIVMLDGGKVRLNEDKNELCEKYFLVQCAEMTESMKASAIGVKENMFGYSFLTTDGGIGGKGVQIKKPTIEEIFVHISGQ